MEKVIVVILTYNLKNYIGKALDSVLSQKTSFDYKILVSDDASTDGTVEILKEYQARYPEKIDLILAEQNVGCLANSNRAFDKIDCEYFALLDGDDYWVGEDRLQAQVDFLDTHKEYSMVGGNTQLLRDGVLSEMQVPEKNLGKSYSFQDMIDYKMPFVHTSAILLRNMIFKDGLPCCFFDAVDSFENCALRGEDFRRILHLEKGPMYIMPELVSVYRIHEQGIWQGSKEIHQKIETLIYVNFIQKYFGDQYGDHFLKELRRAYLDVKLYLRKHEKMWNSCILDQRDIKLLSEVLVDMSEHRKRFEQLDQYVKMHLIKRTVKKVLRYFMIWK